MSRVCGSGLAGLTFHWWYYAHGVGACGAPFNTGIRKTQNVGAGSRLYSIHREVGADGPFWAFRINGVLHSSRVPSDITTCWPTINLLVYMNEMLNINDFNYGTVSNHQHFAEVQYQISNGWHNSSWTLGRECDAHSDRDYGQFNWRCFVSSADHNDFYQWDSRAP